MECWGPLSSWSSTSQSSRTSATTARLPSTNVWHHVTSCQRCQHHPALFGHVWTRFTVEVKATASVKLLLSRWCSIHLDSAWWFAERSRSILGPSCPLFIFVPEVAQVVLVVVAVDSPRALSAAEVLLRPLFLPDWGAGESLSALCAHLKRLAFSTLPTLPESCSWRSSGLWRRLSALNIPYIP